MTQCIALDNEIGLRFLFLSLAFSLSLYFSLCLSFTAVFLRMLFVAPQFLSLAHSLSLSLLFARFSSFVAGLFVRLHIARQKLVRMRTIQTHVRAKASGLKEAQMHGETNFDSNEHMVKKTCTF